MSAAPPAKPPRLPLGFLLALHPTNVDAFLAHLHRCLQTPAGVDTVLLFVGYTSHLASSLLTSAPAAHLRQAARLLLARYLGDAAAKIKLPGPELATTAAGLRALSNLLSEFRMFTRLWSLLGLYLSLKHLAGREMSGEGAKLGAYDRVLPWLQLGSGVALQVLENGAFLSMKGVLKWDPKTTGWAFTWSARFFAASVGLEIGRLLVERVRKETGDKGEKEAAVALAEWRREWTTSFVKMCAWAPLTLHWSVEGGVVSDMAVGALATVPGVIGITRLWKSTA